VPSSLIPIAALNQNIENELTWWRIEPKNSAVFFQHLDHGAALKIERKMSHLNIAFDRWTPQLVTHFCHDVTECSSVAC